MKDEPISALRFHPFSDRRTHICLVLAALTLAVYAQVYSHGYLLVDDHLYVGENARVQAGLSWANTRWAFTTTAAANWHPVTWLSHMLDCQLFGVHLGAHHLVNVLFHLMNVLLLFWLLERMTGAMWPSAFVAAVFALHPLHVESVAWIAERKDVLSTFFWLLTMAAYLGYLKKPSLGRYLAILPLFALGLMAKPMLVTLPCVLLLLDYWPLGRFTPPPAPQKHGKGKPVKPVKPAFPWKVLIEKIPLFGLVVLSSLMTYRAQQGLGAVQTLDMLSLTQRLANAVVSYARYAFHTVWPVHLSTYYPLAKDGLPWWQIATALVFLSGMTALVIWQIRRRPFLGVGWFWYLGTLAPVIGIVQVGSQAMADRYMYVPLIGLGIMAAWGGDAIIPRLPYRTHALAVICGLSIVAMTGLSALQVWYWGDNAVLYAHEVQLCPDSYFAHYQLGIALKKANRIDEAELEFLKTVEIMPNHVDAQLSLGLIAYGKKQYDEAIKHYTVALDHAVGHRNRAETEINFGTVLMETGRFDEAAKHYQIGLQLKPDMAAGHYNLGNALVRLNRPDEAARHYREVLRLEPGNQLAQTQLRELLQSGVATTSSEPKPKLETANDYYEYGNKLAEQNRFAEAAEQYQAALKLKPNELAARINLGNAMAAMGKPQDALTQFQEALKSQPNCGDALINAGNALIELNQFSKARDYFSKATQANPRNAEGWCGLACVLERLNQNTDAAKAYSKAFELDPNNRRAKEGLQELHK